MAFAGNSSNKNEYLSDKAARQTVTPTYTKAFVLNIIIMSLRASLFTIVRWHRHTIAVVWHISDSQHWDPLKAGSGKFKHSETVWWENVILGRNRDFVHQSRPSFDYCSIWHVNRGKSINRDRLKAQGRCFTPASDFSQHFKEDIIEAALRGKNISVSGPNHSDWESFVRDGISHLCILVYMALTID